MDASPDYQTIPSAQVHTPSSPFAQRPWYEGIRSRLPYRTSLRALFLFSAAVTAVLLAVSSTTRASTYSRSIVWARFTTNPVTRTPSMQLAPGPFRSSARPYLPFLHDKWINRGRCYLKCRKEGGPNVCCGKGKRYKERRNACMCDCLGGHIVTPEHCECGCDKKGAGVCCSTSEGPVDKNNACLCECAGDGTVLSEGSCPVVPGGIAPHEAPEETPSCVCDLDFNAVCCQSGDQTTMEINACICKCKPGRVVPTENCYPPSPSPSPAAPALAKPTETPVCECDLDFNAVCCKSGDQNTMEINACICKCKPNGVVVSEINCGAPTPTPKTQKECICPLVFAPVCCKTAKGTAREVNECICGCKDGGKVVSGGYCV